MHAVTAKEKRVLISQLQSEMQRMARSVSQAPGPGRRVRAPSSLSRKSPGWKKLGATLPFLSTM